MSPNPGSRRARIRAACTLLSALVTAAPPLLAEAWRLDTLVPGSPFRSIHGLAFGPDAKVYVGSVIGQSIYRVDPQTGASEVFVPPPTGLADDIEFAPDGTMYWTGFTHGTMNALGPGAEPRVIAAGLPGLNSLALDARGRLFGSQVFLGDALWEFDPAGKQPPRLVMKDLGGLNGFDFGPDGRLCGPLWFRKQVICLDVDSGAMEVVAEGLVQPAAANFDSRGDLHAIDNETGEIFRIDIATHRRERLAQAPTNLDNLAFDAADGLYVTNMSDNAIYAVDLAGGDVRRVAGGGLSMPGGIAAAGSTLYVADTFTLRAVDLAGGAVRDISRSLAQTGFPTSVAAAYGRIATASHESRGVQLRDAATEKPIAQWTGLAEPSALALLDADRLAVTETGQGGRLLVLDRRDTAARQVLAEGLQQPMGVLRIADGYIVSESAAGRITAISDAGERRVLVSGLARPEGIARLDDGTLAVAETGKRRLLLVYPHDGSSAVIAEDLPIGIAGVEEHPPGFPTGVAAGADGAIYVSADRDGSILRLRRVAAPGQ
jgi:sugar lactone lactonase YvrE